ncbi:hypothetical protein AYX07_06210 [Thermoactinomyces sp. AS95]|nr:hypothetical protein JS81_01155 [Thermoactinomyces sp. Gus2-1]KYQ86736.1 hypothetical protein AYX07_06210 [Thermoactinomyces sp. AS95]
MNEGFETRQNRLYNKKTKEHLEYVKHDEGTEWIESPPERKARGLRGFSGTDRSTASSGMQLIPAGRICRYPLMR